MITQGRKQRITGYQVYDFTRKHYYAGEDRSGTPAFSPFKRDAYKCRTRDEAEGLTLLVPPNHEWRVLEIRARSY